MASTRSTWMTQNYRSALSPLDSASEYIREHWTRIAPTYLIAMAPFSAAMYFLINTVASKHRSALPAWCFVLSLATLWKWVFLAVMQRRIQEDIRGDPPLKVSHRIGWILLLHLVASFAALWGSFLIAPAFFGLVFSGILTPMLLEEEGRVWPLTIKSVLWINESSRRLFKTLSAFFALFLAVYLSVIVLQRFLTSLVFTSLLGVNVTEVEMTMSSSAWALSLMYFVYVLFDFYWAAASVMIYYDLRSRRLGSDLRAAFKSIEEAKQ